jgi:hypothetical protein
MSNRAERRRQKVAEVKAEVKTQRFMTEEEFLRITKHYQERLEKTKDATKQIVTDSLLSALLIELKHEWGFGAKRLQRLVDGIHRQLDAIHDKIVEHDELIETAEDIIQKYKLNI